MSKALDKILKSRGLPTTDEHRELNTIPEFISTGDEKLDTLITANASCMVPIQTLTTTLVVYLLIGLQRWLGRLVLVSQH